MQSTDEYSMYIIRSYNINNTKNIKRIKLINQFTSINHISIIFMFENMYSYFLQL